jgi:hypothetical protein
MPSAPRIAPGHRGRKYRSGFYSKSLTNYFIASNQIVKQLRKPSNEYEFLRKV